MTATASQLAGRRMHMRFERLRSGRGESETRRTREIHTLCLVVGTSNADTYFLSDLLNSHPDFHFIDGFDVLDHALAGFGAGQILRLMTPRGSRRSPQTEAVVGEMSAGSTARQLSCAPHLLDELTETMSPRAVKLIHVERNPFDSIAALRLHNELGATAAMHHHFTTKEMLADLRDRVGPSRFRTVKEDRTLADAARELSRIQSFLGCHVDRPVLEECAGAVPSEARSERDLVTWSDDEIRAVNDRRRTPTRQNAEAVRR